MVMKSFNTVIVLVDVVVVVALFITWWPPLLSSLSKTLHHGLVKKKRKRKKTPQTERVFLVCFLLFVLRLIVNISAWHHHTCSCGVHVFMVLFLSRMKGAHHHV